MPTLAEFGQKHLFRGVGKSTELVLEEGKGSYVWTASKEDSLDATGTGQRQKWLDFTCGIGVTSFGHSHPKVVKAAQEQVAKITHAQVNIGYNKRQLDLVQALIPLMPHPSLDSFFFWNSGAEAVEAAVKLARQATKRQNVIVMQGSYHGRTFGTMTMTRSKTVYSAGFHPSMPGIYVTPFPYWRQLGYPSKEIAERAEIDMTEQCLHQLELVLAQQSSAQDTAAIILEPVLGEGGYTPATPAFLKGLREICDREKIVLIVDEVQSGFMRTGNMFGIQTIIPEGFKPDILIMAKGIANGFPLSAIVTRKELSDLCPPGSFGGTYAGNAVSCAAAVAVADIIKNDGIKENIAARSKEMFAALHELQEDPKTASLIADVRGYGLMVGLEFNSPAHVGGLPPRAKSSDNTPSNAKIPEKIASRVSAKCLERGLLTLTTSVYETIRFIPPLTVSKEEMAEGLRIIKEAISEVAEESK